jgi:hypothetical protein
MNMNRILSAIIVATVSVIFVGSILAPQVAEYTGTNGALAEYSGLLGALVVIVIVAILMIGVRLITSGKD